MIGVVTRRMTGMHVAVLLGAAVLAWLLGAPDPVGFWFLNSLIHAVYAAY